MRDDGKAVVEGNEARRLDGKDRAHGQLANIAEAGGVQIGEALLDVELEFGLAVALPLRRAARRSGEERIGRAIECVAPLRIAVVVPPHRPPTARAEQAVHLGQRWGLLQPMEGGGGSAEVE